MVLAIDADTQGQHELLGEPATLSEVRGLGRLRVELDELRRWTAGTAAHSKQ